MLDDFDGFIAALADGFDGAVGLVELLVWWCCGFGVLVGDEGKNDSRRGFRFGGTEAAEEGRNRGLGGLEWGGNSMRNAME